MLRERTKAGLEIARKEGRIGGRPPKLTPQQQAAIRKMASEGERTAADAARLFKKFTPRRFHVCWLGAQDGGWS
jgi:DNA invertase Pin-like site-specific DNA recombinase